MRNDEFRQRLTDYFNEMRRKNPAYSLRAMARSFKTSPAQLSQVMSGKRSITTKFALLASDRLGLSPLEVQNTLQGKSISPESAAQFRLIEEDHFKLISDWYHFAILSLSKLPGNKADAKWVSQRLGIDYHVAKEAFTRLQKLNLIKIEQGRFRQISEPIHTTNDIPSAAIRKNHKQNLELAAGKLDEVDVQLREFTSLTVATSLKKLPTAKKLIRKFKNDLYQLLDSGKKEEVYTLAIQLFPVSKKHESTKEDKP